MEGVAIINNPAKKKRKTLEERYEEFYVVDFETAVRENPYDFELVDWGPDVGEEIIEDEDWSDFQSLL